jgi:hypothetical protein
MPRNTYPVLVGSCPLLSSEAGGKIKSFAFFESSAQVDRAVKDVCSF